MIDLHCSQIFEIFFENKLETFNNFSSKNIFFYKHLRKIKIYFGNIEFLKECDFMFEISRYA